MRFVALILLIFILQSCQEEIARVDLLRNNPTTINFNLQKGEEVKLFADMDIEFVENPLFVFDCEFYFEDKFLFKGGTDPLNTKNNIREKKTENGGIVSWKYYGQLEGTLTSQEDGNYSVKTTFVKNSKPSLKINKAQLVLVK
jgi:hypothetical protein